MRASIISRVRAAQPRAGNAAWLVTAMWVSAAVLAPDVSFAAPEAEPLTRPAMLTPLATHAVMQALARAGDARLVAVGERGIVLLSDDDGRHWRQVPVPVSVALTSVQFVDAKRGWAAGHAGVILHTEDGGEHWTRQLDGATAAQLAMREAQAAVVAEQVPTVTTVTTAHKSPAQIALANARRLVADGADNPFLSLSFSDAQHGTAVGAYGIAVHTDDGGRSWQSWTARVGDSRSLHLYAVRQRGDALWIAGEQGFVARSIDAGRTFTPVPTPYKGSFFALGLGAERGAKGGTTVVLGGLRGNALRSSDGGASFTSIKLDGPVSITDIDITPQGRWLIANQAGQIFASDDAAATIAPLIERPVFPLNGIASAANGTVIGAGFGGVMPVATPRPPNDDAQTTHIAGVKS
jgi:photosystem II stability/assembly factor-like uncharacterized protein